MYTWSRRHHATHVSHSRAREARCSKFTLRVAASRARVEGRHGGGVAPASIGCEFTEVNERLRRRLMTSRPLTEEANMADVHVVPQASRWGLEVAGETRSTHDTQKEAINEGHGLAEQEQGELVIHGQDGQIREKDSHGNDPRDIPG